MNALSSRLPDLFLYLHRHPSQRNHAGEYYDTTDPFIDDSELAQDERTFFAQTKQKGFYVSSGQVALLNKYVLSLLVCGVLFLPAEHICV